MSVLDNRTGVRFSFTDLEALLGIHGADTITGINALSLDRHLIVGITGPGFPTVPPWHEAPLMPIADAGSTAPLEVALERRRQLDELGYDAHHDDLHGADQLVELAVSTLDRFRGREDLVKAAALLLAAIDATDRAYRAGADDQALEP